MRPWAEIKRDVEWVFGEASDMQGCKDPDEISVLRSELDALRAETLDEMQKLRLIHALIIEHGLSVKTAPKTLKLIQAVLLHEEG